MHQVLNWCLQNTPLQSPKTENRVGHCPSSESHRQICPQSARCFGLYPALMPDLLFCFPQPLLRKYSYKNSSRQHLEPVLVESGSSAGCKKKADIIPDPARRISSSG